MRLIKSCNLSRRKSKGKIEDVIMKVDNVLFPVDFVVLEIKVDKDVPLILSRPFLVTVILYLM